jgi:hypothetical protein
LTSGLLLLALVLEVTSHMTLNDIGRDPMVVADELIGQPGAGKAGFRLRGDRLLRPSVQGDNGVPPEKVTSTVLGIG